MKSLVIATSFVLATSTFGADKAQERLEDSERVFSEIMRTPDKGIPEDLLGKAQMRRDYSRLEKGGVCSRR